jgi:UDP-N-acetylglucosamine diphosphorylase/glucosamine-1-phosphate N-acetyltransferase
MNEQNFSIVILAAGLGKRMNNPDIPKVMTELNKQPLIYYVLETAISLKPDKIVIVVGHKKDILISYINDIFLKLFPDFSKDKILFVEQKQQIGTGDAVKSATQYFTGYNGEILILSGDVPMLSSNTLINFINLHNNNVHNNKLISVLSATTDNPYNYGRIVRNSESSFSAIIEEKDATDSIKQIKEINSGIYYLNSILLFELLNKVNNNNQQNEYYLTDIISLGIKNEIYVEANNIATFEEIQGVNTTEQLQQIEINHSRK